jgi:hypothetical protein
LHNGVPISYAIGIVDADIDIARITLDQTKVVGDFGVDDPGIPGGRPGDMVREGLVCCRSNSVKDAV